VKVWEYILKKKLRITIVEDHAGILAVVVGHLLSVKVCPELFCHLEKKKLTVLCQMPGKKWTTPEQEDYLLSFMSKFRESAAVMHGM
jgi:hypothetical protein